MHIISVNCIVIYVTIQIFCPLVWQWYR